MNNVVFIHERRDACLKAELPPSQIRELLYMAGIRGQSLRDPGRQRIVSDYIGQLLGMLDEQALVGGNAPVRVAELFEPDGIILPGNEAAAQEESDARDTVQGLLATAYARRANLVHYGPVA